MVGLVIGGIWAAASTVRFNWQVNKTFEGVNFIAASVQRSLTLENGKAIGSNHITCYVEKAGGLPKDWGKRNCIYIVSPLGAEVEVYNASGGGEGFSIWIKKLSKSACIKLGMKLSTEKAHAKKSPTAPGFVAISDLYDGSTNSIPWTLQQVTSKCTDNSTIGIDYNYTRFR